MHVYFIQFGGGETLEESLLTANVPGRYSKWDKNDPGSRDVPRYESGDESEHEEEPDGYRYDPIIVSCGLGDVALSLVSDGMYSRFICIPFYLLGLRRRTPP
jgi:hypothetical protein